MVIKQADPEAALDRARCAFRRVSAAGTALIMADAATWLEEGCRFVPADRVAGRSQKVTNLRLAEVKLSECNSQIFGNSLAPFHGPEYAIDRASYCWCGGSWMNPRSLA